MKNTITISSTLFSIIFNAKKAILAFLLLCSSFVGFAQTSQEVASVEKFIFGVQIGLSGLGAYNELKISNQITLRSEILSIDLGTSVEPKKSFLTEFMFVLEPRWYYNLKKRADKGKRIDGNSGNYVSLRATYFLFDISELGKMNYNQPLLAAAWGINRYIGNHFYYDVGVGGGLGFDNDNVDKAVFIPYINLRIGYRF